MTDMTDWRGEIVGHRGAAGLAPENTLAAMEAGIAAGADRLEFDVRATVDGHAVVFHDARLDRFRGPGAAFDKMVGRLPLAELTAIDVGEVLGTPGCLIPSLDDVLRALAGRVRLNVEAKGSGADGLITVAACIRGIRAHGVVADTILSSFHEPVLRRAAADAEDIARGFIADDRTSGDPVAIARGVGSVALHASVRIADGALMVRCRDAGLQLRVWTVNDPVEMKRWIDAGVDGIVTDFPDRLRAVAGR